MHHVPSQAGPIARGASLVEWLLSRFSYVVVPAAITLLTLFALYGQESFYTSPEPLRLEFRALPDAEATFTPAAALTELRSRPLVAQRNTYRAEFPFWILVPQLQSQHAYSLIEFPSRHATEVTCRDADTLHALGTADRHSTSGALERTKAGFAIDLGTLSSRPDALLCRIAHTGPGRITVLARSPSELGLTEHAFHHGAGMLEGGLLTLAFFTLVMAAINRESRYVLLAVWLVCNLRMAALSMGWDTQWLGREIPPDWMSSVRKLTMATYYLITYALFSEFFRQDLNRVGYSWLLRLAQTLGLALMGAALIAPYATFLPILWSVSSFGIAVIIFFLARILIFIRSRTALWVSLALVVVLLATFSEVLAAAFGLRFLITSFNSITAALASSLLVTMAMAEQMRAEKQERVRAQEELSRTYESTPVGLFTLDANGRFLRTNTAMQSMLGLGTDVPANRHWSEHFETGAWDTLQHIAAQEGGGEAELRGRPRDDEPPPWFLVRAVQLGDWIEGSLQDITERVEATDRLRYLANHDPLTGALNRHGIEGVLTTSVASAGRDRPLVVAYLDLDRFKLVNDLYRNQAGDEVLKQVSERIHKVLATDHFLGRLGGDEFLVVMRDTHMDIAARRAERILQVVNDAPYRFGNQSFQVQVSIGLIEVSPGMDAADAVSTAERACREAKSGHSAPLVAYARDSEAHKGRAEELRLIKALGNKHLPAGLHLVMQPIMSLRRPHDSLNFEILLRMRDSAGNNVPVNKVLDAAEASGNMARLDKWVLTQTLQWLERNQAQLPKTRFVSVNFSGASLNDQTFVRDILDILARYESVVPRLCIEITEGVALHDLQYTSDFISRIKARGASIALDDFGSGYTSFTYLSNLQADALKIDGAFVQSMSRHPANVAIVAAIVELARNLGMRSIAEGVEDATMLETLAEIGADYIQGYVIARPQSLETLLAADSAASYIDEPELAELVRRLADERNAADDAAAQEGPANYH